MKRAALFLLLAATTIVLTNGTAEAGSGKNTKAKIQVTNTNAAGGRAITIFVIPNGTPTPTTKAQALALVRKNVGAGKTEVFELNNGTYAVAAADTVAFNGLADNAAIPANSFALKTGVVLTNNTSVTLTTNTPANANLPFKPTLN